MNPHEFSIVDVTEAKPKADGDGAKPPGDGTSPDVLEILHEFVKKWAVAIVFFPNSFNRGKPPKHDKATKN